MQSPEECRYHYALAKCAALACALLPLCHCGLSNEASASPSAAPALRVATKAEGALSGSRVWHLKLCYKLQGKPQGSWGGLAGAGRGPGQGSPLGTSWLASL